MTRATIGIAAALIALAPAAALMADDGRDDDDRPSHRRDDDHSTTHTGTTTAPTAPSAPRDRNRPGRTVVACSAGSTATLKASRDDGRVEVEWEVDQNTAGERWSWSIGRGGRTLASGVATTESPSGSFSVERRVRKQAGRDVITARATRSGETCAASVTVSR